MRGTFGDKTLDLERLVGEGTLEGQVIFPGPSSGALERGHWVTGPNAGVRIRYYHGGDAHFLAQALVTVGPGALRSAGREAIRGEPVGGMEEAVKRVMQAAAARAPQRTGTLRRSAGWRVVQRGVIVSAKSPARKST